MRSLFTLLFKAFFDICLFRKRPQDLPVARELFWLTIVLYALASSVLSFPTQSVFHALLTGLIEVLMLLLITWLFLFLRSVPERWLQTSTALAGTGLIFSLLAVPLFYWRVFATNGAGMQTLTGMLVLMLIFWNIAVMAHILKNALSSSYFLAVLGSLSYIAMITFTLQWLLPGPGAV